MLKSKLWLIESDYADKIKQVLKWEKFNGRILYKTHSSTFIDPNRIELLKEKLAKYLRNLSTCF